MQFQIKSVLCSNVSAAGETISQTLISNVSVNSIVPNANISSGIAMNSTDQRDYGKMFLQRRGEIDHIFKAQHLSKTLLSNFVMDNLIHLEPSNLAHLMRVTGKLTKSRRDMLLRYYMPAISARLKMLSSRSWSFSHISYVIFGLQRMDESDDGILDILQTMTSISNETAKRSILPLPQDVSMMLLGLETNFCTEKETKIFLTLMVKMIKSCKSDFGAYHISSSLFGLQHATSDSVEVQAVLTALTERIYECKEDFCQKNIGAALYGLQGMSSNEPVVLALLVALEAKINSCPEALSPNGASQSLHGLQRMSSDHVEVRNILRALVSRMKNMTESMDAMRISDAMIGLQGMSSDCPEVLALLRAITPSMTQRALRQKNLNVMGIEGKKSKENEDEKESIETAVVEEIQESKESNEGKEIEVITKITDDQGEVKKDKVELERRLDAQGVKNVFRGMRRMNSDSSEVRALLKVLGPRLLRSSQTMNVLQLRAAFSGMRGLEGIKIEVRPLVATLVKKVKQCKQIFSPLCVGTSLASMVRLSSDKYEVRYLAASLVRCVDLCQKPLTAKLMGDAMFGLQLMSSDHAEVALLIKSVTVKVSECLGVFDDEDICHVLCGLREMNSHTAEVPPLVRALTSKMVRFTEFKTSKELSDSIFGLQGMTTDCPDFTALLAFLTPKIVQFKDPFQPEEIIRALYGLQGVRTGENSVQLMDWLFTKLEGARETSLDFEKLSTTDIVQLCQILTIMLPTLEGIDSAKWVEMSDRITREVEARRRKSDVFFKEEKPLSTYAKRVVTVLEKYFEATDVKIVKGQELCGLFGSEILLQIPSESRGSDNRDFESDILVNIEITYSSDRLDQQKKYCVLRDSYLNSKGVKVLRLTLAQAKNSKDGNLPELVTKFVEDAKLK